MNRSLLHAAGCGVVCLVVLLSTAAREARAVSYAVNVDGVDAIFLAGRTDLTIPDASLPWTGPGDYLVRHPSPTPEEALESLPSGIGITAGDVVRVLDPTIGGIDFYNGFGPPYFGPSGNSLAGSSVGSLGGISGYAGPQGPLTGVFLDDSVPSAGPAPSTIDFTPAGIGVDFPELSPELGQVFYIGDGVTSGGVFQEFTAPAGATRLFLGIPDGFGFSGPPGAYDDNDGSYRVVIGVNELPVIPEPTAATLVALAACCFARAQRRRR
ncbi:hypothetical protein Pla123a_05390 [Posidoniimonas polymericola]|uniref:PEP-CTERM protein-sorting domain-containing protein n=1 Tax=Posidoniimonas polymericola TaxID=2528002 RepID=A0A5C5ZEI0_9BACT|nr:PEP-CTERM sorting domain-containing protein [Posidoniimonas polymericola]TWT85732.1 hypothetical protein Pla123a_05390 [Posidoniimonas polymericola]